jgi:putative transposase
MVVPSSSTIRQYMVPHRRPPRGGQAWRTSVRNHATELWACDFLTQYTATFTVAYVFVIMEIASRRIVHCNVTTAPTLAWVTQQLRDATPWGTTPRLLLALNEECAECPVFSRWRSRKNHLHARK